MRESRYLLTIDGEKKEILISPDGDRWTVNLDGRLHHVEEIIVEKDEIFSLIIDGKSYMVDLLEKDWDRGQFTIGALAGQKQVIVRDELEAIAEEMASAGKDRNHFQLEAPMPGIVVRRLLKEGDPVEKGEGILVLEAMKMQNELASEIEGNLGEYLVEEGQMVETGALLARVIREVE